MREVPPLHEYKSGDILVVFGELFNRGYVNGIIDEAAKVGMKIITATMGRREKDQTLRPLTDDELAEKSYPIINIPLEAGFDLEKSNSGHSPVDQLLGVKLNAWDQVKLNWDSVEESRKKGQWRFCEQTKKFLAELEQHITDEVNVLFVHTMAGGFPRARIIMPIANKIFKGSGDRYASSQEFWVSDIGKLCEKNFNEVTCETFRHLIELSSELRTSIEARGNNVSYVAYGYHGTDVLIDDEFKWQSYSPYLQGWAKICLEGVAKEKSKEGIKATIYNAPEILTNSSSIFLGVEIPLYRLLASFRKLSPDSDWTHRLVKRCQQLLKEEHHLESLDEKLEKYFKSDIVARWSHFPDWPQHNGPEQMKLMRETALGVIHMHKSDRELMTADLSEIVFRGCGKLILADSWSCPRPVTWLGHDIITQVMVT